MSRKDELIAIAKSKYSRGQKVEALKGGVFQAYNDTRQKSDNHYSFCDSPDSFHYDPVGDTLCNWGMGMGLIYRQGVWAGDPEINYQIY